MWHIQWFRLNICDLITCVSPWYDLHSWLDVYLSWTSLPKFRHINSDENPVSLYCPTWINRHAGDLIHFANVFFPLAQKNYIQQAIKWSLTQMTCQEQSRSAIKPIISLDSGSPISPFAASGFCIWQSGGVGAEAVGIDRKWEYSRRLQKISRDIDSDTWDGWEKCVN